MRFRAVSPIRSTEGQSSHFSCYCYPWLVHKPCWRRGMHESSRLFDQLRRESSETYRIQLSA